MTHARMAHKTAVDARRQRSKSCSKLESKMHENRKEPLAEEPTQEETAEFKDRFIGFDETDRVYSKVHVLKTRSSSEQNLILKTSTLRRREKSSISLLNQKTDCDKLNNNSTARKILAKSAECLKVDSESKPKQPESVDVQSYKKNSNVYSVFQAKTVLKERRRSLPTLPKLISQKLHEHNQKSLSKSVDSAESVAAATKDFREKTFRTLSKGLGRLLKRHSSVNISEPDPVFKVAYLGNVLTGWAKGMFRS